MTTTEKTCFKCRVTKPITEFYAHPQMWDGRLNKCKECTKRDVSENYRANIHHYVEYERKRFKKTERKEAARRYLRERRPTEKRIANQKASYAIRSGALIRKPCEVCGAIKTEAHHDDYSKPLDVRWLCRKHHLEHHGKVQRAQAA